MSELKKLEKAIKKIKGDKIVTIATTKGQSQSFDVFENGDIGHAIEHVLIYKKILIECKEFGGSVIVRAFSKMTYDSKNIKGKIIKLPYKKIYGVYFVHKKCYFLNKDQVKSMYDHNEDGVIYKEFPKID